MCVRAPAVLKGGRRQRRGGLIESLTSAVGSTASHRCSLRQHHRLRTSSTGCCAHDSLRLLCSLSFLKVVARAALEEELGPRGSLFENPSRDSVAHRRRTRTAPWMRAWSGESAERFPGTRTPLRFQLLVVCCGRKKGSRFSHSHNRAVKTRNLKLCLFNAESVCPTELCCSFASSTRTCGSSCSNTRERKTL